MRLALAPINPTVGGLAGNADLVIAAIDRAQGAAADLIVLPELVVCGYPPKDLLWQEGFVEASMAQTRRIAQSTKGIVAIVGGPWRLDETDAIANSLLVLRDGAIVGRYDKRLLPTYDVFDEDRYFTPGDRALVIEIAGWRVGLAVCEDLWRGDDAGFSARYQGRPDPVSELVKAGAQLIVSPSASPFVLGKTHAQLDLLRGHVDRHNVALASLNQLGANDDLIFDGRAIVLAPDHYAKAKVVAAGELFSDRMLVHDLSADAPAPTTGAEAVIQSDEDQQLFDALTLGVRDYVRKTGFARIVIGLSGGIDSAVTAVIAARALGAANVLCVSMPSRFSSAGSIADAQQLASALDVRLVAAPIETMHNAIEHAIGPLFQTLGADASPGVAEENIQARLRGLTLMAISNKLGNLLLTTGNKSELAVGYCTLYGDMNGGLAVLSDVPKTQVYRLARWINAHPDASGLSSPPIPQSTIDKPPSAELRANQTDQDTLPDYEILDEIIHRNVVEKQSPQRIIEQTGLDPAFVHRVVTLINRSEYKRTQAAIGLKVTSVAFGSGRRFPIAHLWKPRPNDF